MVLHVGVNFTKDPEDQTIKIYNSETKEVATYELPFKPTNYNDDEFGMLFGTIVSKTNGQIGSVCICIGKHSNARKKSYLQKAKFFGIENLVLLDCITALLLHILAETNVTFTIDEYLWVLLNNTAVIFQKTPEKMIFVKGISIEEIPESLNLKPTAVMYYFKDYEVESLFKSAYPDCKCYPYHECSTASGALIKARLMAKDESFTFLDIDGMSPSYQLTIGNSVILKIEAQTLSLHKTATVDDNVDSNLLKVEYFDFVDYFIIPNLQKFNINFKVDTNGIYSITYTSLNGTPILMEQNNLQFDVNFEFTHFAVQFFKILAKDNILNSLFCELSEELVAENPNKDYRTILSHLRSLAAANSFQPLAEYFLPKKIEDFKNDINAVGIDLGTTRSCMVVSRANKFETVALGHTGDRLLPSYVTYEKGEKAICGQFAIDMIPHRKSVIFDAKRLIGKKFSEIQIDDTWPFQVYNDSDTILLGIESKEIPTLVSPISVSTELLFYMKEKGKEFQHCDLDEVVVTTPAAFTSEQNVETVAAAILAGWKKVHLLPEPLAAAFAYFIERPLQVGSNVLVFDLGELTSIAFDASKNGVITITRNDFEKMCQELLTRIRKVIGDALNNSYNCQVDGIILVGGGSRMPMVQNCLKNFFPKAELRCDENPDEVVALGAAYYAYYIKSEAMVKKPTRSSKFGNQRSNPPPSKKKDDCKIV